MASIGSVGKLRERLTIEENTPDPFVVSNLTRSGATVTATTVLPHGFATGDFVVIAGATPSGYNGTVKITVTGATTFTYGPVGALSTPATGVIWVTYVSDPQGNKKVGWQTLDEIPAEMIPISADERLAAASIPALASVTRWRFRVQARADLTDQMRARWTPRWPPNAPEHVLEITGILPDEDGRRFQFLECVE